MSDLSHNAEYVALIAQAERVIAQWDEEESDLRNGHTNEMWRAIEGLRKALAHNTRSET